MRSRVRSLIAATAVAVAAVTGGVVAAAPAGAAPPPRDLPVFAPFGQNFGAFGDHDFCRGSMNVRISSPKRGVARVTLTSFGFTGSGRGWTTNPNCGLLVGVTATNGLFQIGETFFNASFGPRPGAKVTRDIATGSGLRSFGVASYARNSPVRLLQSYGTGLYFIVP
ncbi:enoyl-CoA hydratase [Williamsia serinedens]|uniref:Secreted protein n=1 Tax=Williamsia serinedens TaxID=391736 RepID=A0ABT1GXW0_9NOCA|nr:enoyl-CoA hydratase [Williamsia serinedens]MCP2159829.1 hypothetical protein [Williamsia serinedens]